MLAVLVILAGLILPKLDGVLGKAHSANGAATIGEVAKYVETYKSLHGGSFPDLFDSMLSDTGTGTHYSKLLPGALTKYVPQQQLTAAEVTSLQLVGITRVATLREFHADLTNPNRNFYVLGVGPACTIVGEGGVTLDAPLHQDTNPGLYYNRFVVIIAPDPTGDDKAVLIGTVGPDGDSMRKHINEFYAN